MFVTEIIPTNIKKLLSTTKFGQVVLKLRINVSNELITSENGQ